MTARLRCSARPAGSTHLLPCLCETPDESLPAGERTFPLPETAGDPLVPLPARRRTHGAPTTPGGRAESALFRALVQRSPDMLLLLADDGQIRYTNPSVERCLGHRGRDMVGRPVLSFIHPEDADEAAVLLAAGEDEDDPRPSVLRVRHRTGEWLRLEVIARNLLDDPSVAGIVVTARDVTERIRLEEQLMRLAFQDALTGLPNRAVFMDRLSQTAEYHRRRTGTLAVLFLDLDRFKDVNDEYGHAAGDALLVQVARRLAACVRPEDTVARLGGDEFTILLDGVGGPAEVTAVARRIAAALRRPFSVEGRRLSVSASIGVACSASPHPRPEEILRLADSALYRAKEARDGRFCLVTTEFER